MNCVQKFVRATARVAFCLICAIAAAPAAEQDDATRLANKLTELSARELKIDLPDASVEIAGPLELKVSRAGNSWHAYLYNLYSYCERNIEDCGQAIVAQAAEFKAAHQDDDRPLSKSNLRVVVRDGAHVEQLEQHYGEGTNTLVEPISGDLWAMVVEDRPTSVRYPKPAEIRALGLSEDAGLKLAMANTKAALEGRVPQPTPKDKNTLSVLSGDDFVTTFAFPELWAPVASTFGGTLIVAVTSTDQMYFIGDDDRSALELIRKVSGDEWARSMRPLSRSLYRWSEKGWIEIVAPSNQPASQASPRVDDASQTATGK